MELNIYGGVVYAPSLIKDFKNEEMILNPQQIKEFNKLLEYLPKLPDIFKSTDINLNINMDFKGDCQDVINEIKEKLRKGDLNA